MASAPEYTLALSSSGHVGGGMLTVNARLNDNRYRSLRATDVEAGGLGAYLETTALPGFKTTLTGKALLGADGERLRRFYLPDRAGAYSGLEMRGRQVRGGSCR